MAQEHPITPPPELFKEWLSEALLQHDAKPGTVAAMVADKAAQWGADQEMEACIAWLEWQKLVRHENLTAYLRATRRPKPLSVKEQALEQYAHIERILHEHGYTPANCVLEALEALPNEN